LRLVEEDRAGIPLWNVFNKYGTGFLIALAAFAQRVQAFSLGRRIIGCLPGAKCPREISPLSKIDEFVTADQFYQIRFGSQ
jgi:hypothetical protein